MATVLREEGSFAPDRAQSERPLPFGYLFGIDTKRVRVVLTGDLVIEESLSNARSGNAETRHPVDAVDRQAEAISLVLDRQFEGRVDVPLLLIAAHMDIMLAGPPIGKP